MAMYQSRVARPMCRKNAAFSHLSTQQYSLIGIKIGIGFDYFPF